MTARNSIASARNRKAMIEAEWKAEGCAERTRAAIQTSMTSVTPERVIATWDSLDKIIANSPYIAGTSCNVTTKASGAALNINSADSEQLVRMFNTIGISSGRSDSL